MKLFFKQLALGIVFLLLPVFLFAEEPNFSVTIVGSRQFQEHNFQSDQADQDRGCPWIEIPAKPVTEATLESDSAIKGHFYVIVRNLSKTSVRLSLDMASWYDCLSFEIIAPDGKSFRIHRPPTAWAANPEESWIFQPDEVRIFTVNFLSGRWEGFPPEGEIPYRLPFQMKASFSYTDFNRKTDLTKIRKFDSNVTEVRDGP